MDNHREAALARWLNRNHRVITVADARRLGFNDRTLARLARVERLWRRHLGVYTADEVSPATPAGWLTDATAALAAGGSRASLARRSAAWMWQWLDQPPWPVEIVVPTGANARLQRVDVSRTRAPSPPRYRDGLRLTDPIRTLIDLAGSWPGLLPGVVDRAVASQLFRYSDLYEATRPGGPHRLRGLAVLRAHLEWVGYLGAPAPSVLESLTARMFRDHDLAPPKVEVATGDDGQYRVDFAYPHLMLAIEVDGYIWHSSRERFERDLARRNQLQAMGWTVLVFTWRQVADDPDGVAAEIWRTYRRLAQAA